MIALYLSVYVHMLHARISTNGLVQFKTKTEKTYHNNYTSFFHSCLQITEQSRTLQMFMFSLAVTAN